MEQILNNGPEKTSGKFEKMKAEVDAAKASMEESFQKLTALLIASPGESMTEEKGDLYNDFRDKLKDLERAVTGLLTEATYTQEIRHNLHK